MTDLTEGIPQIARELLAPFVKAVTLSVTLVLPPDVLEHCDEVHHEEIVPAAFTAADFFTLPDSVRAGHYDVSCKLIVRSELCSYPKCHDVAGDISIVYNATPSTRADAWCGVELETLAVAKLDSATNLGCWRCNGLDEEEIRSPWYVAH